MSLPETLDITSRGGDALEITVAVKDSGGSDYDFTGDTVSMAVYNWKGDTKLAKTSADSEITLSSGEVAIYFGKDNSAISLHAFPLGDYTWELNHLDGATGRRATWLRGDFTRAARWQVGASLLSTALEVPTSGAITATATGIASAESFGTAAITVSVSPSGIASAESLGTASVTIVAPPATADLIAHYLFAEGTGDTVANEVSASYDEQLGTASGADANDPTWVSGVGLQYDGTNDESKISSLPAFTAFTIGFLVRVDSFADFGSVFHNRSGSFYRVITRTGNEIDFEDEQNNVKITATGMDEDAWYRIIARMDAGTMDLYTNGVHVGAVSGGRASEGAGNWFTGQGLAGSRAAITMAARLIYDAALSGSDIADLDLYLDQLRTARGLTPLGAPAGGSSSGGGGGGGASAELGILLNW